MTEEQIKEKAKEIASKYERWNQEDDESYGAYNAAMEMAEWKDKQFAEEKKQWVEKAAKWLDNNQRVYQEYDESGFYKEKSQHLIEDFKKAMEE